MERFFNIKSFTILTLCLWLSKAERDFQFENVKNDGIQMTLTEAPVEHNIKPVIHKKITYATEVSQCPYTERKIILSLVLKSYDWDHIGENKRNKAVSKLSTFFAIPKEYVQLGSVSPREIREMSMRSIKRGPNKSEKNRSLGKIEFMIGCGRQFFAIGDPITNQIGQQMKDGFINEITGIDFGWWIVWNKKVSNRVQRFKREAEGSGDGEGEEYFDYDYEEGDEDDDDDEEMEHITELPAVTTHAHRHHHGIPKPQYTDNSSKKTDKDNKHNVDSNSIEGNNNKKHKKNEFKPQSPPPPQPSLPPTTTTTTTTKTIQEGTDSNSKIISKKIDELDEDIAKSLSKLEFDITKTIENTKRFKDIPLETITGGGGNTDLIKIENENDVNLVDKTNNDVSIKMDSNASKTYEDYVIEDFISEVAPIGETTLATPINVATISNPKIDSTFIIKENKTKITTTINEQSFNPSSTRTTTTITTPKEILLEHTTLQSIVPTTFPPVKKSFDETTIVSYTDEIVTNFENRIIKPFTTSTTITTTTTTLASPSTELTSIINNESTELTTTTFASISISKKDKVADDGQQSKIENHNRSSSNRFINPTISSINEADSDDDSIGNEDEMIPETTTFIPDIEFISHVETTTPSTSTTSSTTTTTTVAVPSIQSTTTTSTTTPAAPSSIAPSTTTTTTTTTTTPSPTTTTTTTEYIEPEPINSPPMIKNRLPKQPVTAGKPFSLTVPLETFYDNEDGTNLRLELLDKNGNVLKGNSWIQFNPEKREIYGLPVDDAVSRWQYKLIASDSKNESVTETLDISVQQHKGHRSVNHEITIAVKLNRKFLRNIDWQIRLIRGIIETLNDNSMSSVVVREIRQSLQDPHAATFIYTNETLPKDTCPEEQLNELVKRLDYRKLTDSLIPELSVKSVTGQLIGPCQKPHAPKPKPTPHMTKNYPPVPRNQVDRVNATIGHLLVYKVPSDTFYDPEDTTDLKLSLLTIERMQIKPAHWLQFDSKNQEFFGIPKNGDYGSEEYLLVAEDHEGLTATDALVVVVNHPPKREYSVLFKITLGIRYDTFNNAYMQRKFIERLAQLFNDSPSNVQIRSIQHLPDGESIMISFYNTTLMKTHHRCPTEEIEIIRNIWFYQDSILWDRVKKLIGNEFNIIGVTINPLGHCNVPINGDISHDKILIKTEDRSTSSSSSSSSSSSTFKDEYLLTFVLPAILILAMVLLASVIACVLHRRRLTGKMELGDEEERRSFRSKGIPVIFQDELDEKPEIGNKSPIILKDEKPPLLPPSYNSTNLDGDNDVDEYVPPPAVVMGGREVRGKSPVTPSYRKPPPYVSP